MKINLRARALLLRACRPWPSVITVNTCCLAVELLTVARDTDRQNREELGPRCGLLRQRTVLQLLTIPQFASFVRASEVSRNTKELCRQQNQRHLKFRWAD